MNKEEIIHAVAFAMVPDSAVLVEVEVSPRVLLVNGNAEGLKIREARIYYRMLTVSMEQLPSSELTPSLFVALHTALLDVNRLFLKKTVRDRQYIIENHSAMVRKMQAIAREAGISYCAPADSLLI